MKYGHMMTSLKTFNEFLKCNGTHRIDIHSGMVLLIVLNVTLGGAWM